MLTPFRHTVSMDPCHTRELRKTPKIANEAIRFECLTASTRHQLAPSGALPLGTTTRPAPLRSGSWPFMEFQMMGLPVWGVPLGPPGARAAFLPLLPPTG